MPEEEKEPIASESSAPEFPGIKPRRKKRPFKIKDKDSLANSIVGECDRNIEARQERQNLRMDRTAKLRGWLPVKTFPWADSANFWFPLMLTYDLRTKSTLENAVKGMRPAMVAKAQQRLNKKKEQKIDQILDYQFFTENNGEKFIDDYVANFVEDEAVFAFVPWVRKMEGYRDIRVLKPLTTPEGQDPLPELIAKLEEAIPALDKEQGTKMLDQDGWDWEVAFTMPDQERNVARVEFYEREDGNIDRKSTRLNSSHSQIS